jgi:glycosyltransferase involved in cell wall biosynthesis
MTPWKGQDIVIRAFAGIAKHEPRLKLLIAGGARNHEEEQKHEAKLRQLAADSGLSDRIIFTGWTEKALETMKSLDVFVHVPVRPDPFPTVIIHAMCQRRPIIASRIGGIPEMTEGTNGAILTEPGNVPELSDAMSRMSRDSALRLSWSESICSIRQV